MTWRIFSAMSTPPGSRVVIKGIPFSSSRGKTASRTDDFPAPSGPSNEINVPFTIVSSF